MEFDPEKHRTEQKFHTRVGNSTDVKAVTEIQCSLSPYTLAQLEGMFLSNTVIC